MNDYTTEVSEDYEEVFNEYTNPNKRRLIRSVYFLCLCLLLFIPAINFSGNLKEFFPDVYRNFGDFAILAEEHTIKILSVLTVTAVLWLLFNVAVYCVFAKLYVERKPYSVGDVSAVAELLIEKLNAENNRNIFKKICNRIYLKSVISLKSGYCKEFKTEFVNAVTERLFENEPLNLSAVVFMMGEYSSYIERENKILFSHFVFDNAEYLNETADPLTGKNFLSAIYSAQEKTDIPFLLNPVRKNVAEHFGIETDFSPYKNLKNKRKYDLGAKIVSFIFMCLFLAATEVYLLALYYAFPVLSELLMDKLLFVIAVAVLLVPPILIDGLFIWLTCANKKPNYSYDKALVKPFTVEEVREALQFVSRATAEIAEQEATEQTMQTEETAEPELLPTEGLLTTAETEETTADVEKTVSVAKNAEVYSLTEDVPDYTEFILPTEEPEPHIYESENNKVEKNDADPDKKADRSKRNYKKQFVRFLHKSKVVAITVLTAVAAEVEISVVKLKTALKAVKAKLPSKSAVSALFKNLGKSIAHSLSDKHGEVGSVSKNRTAKPLRTQKPTAERRTAPKKQVSHKETAKTKPKTQPLPVFDFEKDEELFARSFSEKGVGKAKTEVAAGQQKKTQKSVETVPKTFEKPTDDVQFVLSEQSAKNKALDDSIKNYKKQTETAIAEEKEKIKKQQDAVSAAADNSKAKFTAETERVNKKTLSKKEMARFQKERARYERQKALARQVEQNKRIARQQKMLQERILAERKAMREKQNNRNS